MNELSLSEIIVHIRKPYSMKHCYTQSCWRCVPTNYPRTLITSTSMPPQIPFEQCIPHWKSNKRDYRCHLKTLPFPYRTSIYWTGPYDIILMLYIILFTILLHIAHTKLSTREVARFPKSLPACCTCNALFRYYLRPKSCITSNTV